MNAYPITDEAAEDLDAFQFEITNTCGVGVDYNIDLEILETENRMESKNIATKIDKENKIVLSENTKVENLESAEQVVETHKLYSGTLNAYTSKEHSLRLWLDYNAGNDAQKKTLESKVVIEATQNEFTSLYKDAILNGADPVLNEELVPVKINNQGKVTKADLNNEWYSYEKREWANAVLLTEEGKKKDIDAGDEIEENDIESYFVWIPKYRYKLWDLGEYTTASSITNKGDSTAIEIEFGLNNTEDEKNKECTTPRESGGKGECQKEYWMTHPAFLAFDTNGLWVGKFETSTPGDNKVEIKPNKSAWRNISVSSSYTISKDYKNDLFSHLMKNTEWGAAAYLTQSIYGRCMSKTSCVEVTINGYSGLVTGYSSTNIPYTNPNSVASSTTNNYSGIYDMSGGVYEQQASVIKNSTGSGYSFSQSDFTNDLLTTDTRYYDIYNYHTNYGNWNRRILGDATGELGPFAVSGHINIGSFWNDDADFVDDAEPFFYRGGYVTEGSSVAGIFAYAPHYGYSSPQFGFRIVLAPKSNNS